MSRRLMSLRFITLIFIAPTLLAADAGSHWNFGFTERFRLVTWDNAITLDNSANAARTFTRHRTQVDGTWTANSQVSLRAQLTNEFRYYSVPSNIDIDFDEVIVDQLYLKINQIWETPLGVTIGRQNIMLGEGFIIWDGGPLDGSRSAYFNAVRFDWSVRPDQLLTTFASYANKTDNWLPVIHDQNRMLLEQPETGAGIFLSVDGSKRDLEGYLVFKRRGATETIPTRTSTTVFGGSFSLGLLRTENCEINAKAELGYQLGKVGALSRRAIGGYGDLSCSPHWANRQWFTPTSITFGLIYLSGDNSETETREDWDPMFARWPKWSESYIYTQVMESAVAWWSNLVSLNTSIGFDLGATIRTLLTYHHLWAPQSTSAASSFPGGTGTTRGDLFIGKLSFEISKHWSGHLLWEGFSPGNFYFDGADSYSWIRTELLFRY